MKSTKSELGLRTLVALAALVLLCALFEGLQHTPSEKPERSMFIDPTFLSTSVPGHNVRCLVR
jgi:hypothetical protein